MQRIHRTDEDGLAFRDSSTRRSALAELGALFALLHTSPALAQPASAAAEEAKAPPLPAIGSTMTVPAIDLLQGAGRFDPAAAQGKPLLIYWWSSTCPFCGLQSPSMEKLWQSQKGGHWQMLALSIDRKTEDAETYLRARGYSFPAAWASPAWRTRFPKPKGLPITLVIGRDGKVLLAEKGQMFDEDVQAMAGLLTT